MARTWHRWLPAGAAVALIAGTVTLTSQAGAVDLPDKSPQDVLTLLTESDVEAFSGTFETSTELGLPVPADLDLGPGAPDLDDAELELPSGPPHRSPGGSDRPDALSALELLTGDNTGRVFVGGPGTARLQHLDGMEERNVVVTEDDVWFYDSATNEAVHLLLPERSEPTAPPEHAYRGELPTPQELASMAVEALEPSTELTVGQHERVAGRDAYTLTLAPRAEETLVESVTIAVDGETGFPLGVTVVARGQAEPALHAAYTDIDLSAPDASLFDFSPPADAAVTEETLDVPEHGEYGILGEHGEFGGHDDGEGGPATFGWGGEGARGLGPHGTTPPQVIGDGWGAVVVVDDVRLPQDTLLDQLTEPVAGGRLLSTSLLNVLLTDDGRVLAGAVTAEHLLHLAAR